MFAIPCLTWLYAIRWALLSVVRQLKSQPLLDIPKPMNVANRLTNVTSEKELKCARPRSTQTRRMQI